MGSTFSFLYLILALLTKISSGKKCQKNYDIGWREGNVYECTDPLYPACCEVYREFTCCEEPSVKNLREQLQLWCTLIVIAFLLMIVYLYYNNDTQPCCSCDTLYACAMVFKRIWYACSKRQKTFEVKGDERTGLYNSKVGSLPKHHNVYEQMTVA